MKDIKHVEPPTEESVLAFIASGMVRERKQVCLIC